MLAIRSEMPVADLCRSLSSWVRYVILPRPQEVVAGTPQYPRSAPPVWSSQRYPDGQASGDC